MLAAPSWRHWIKSGYEISHLYSYTIPRTNQSPAYKQHLTGVENPEPPGGVLRTMENEESSQPDNATQNEKENEEANTTQNEIEANSENSEITDQLTEEELAEQGRIGLIEVETQGKKYFKPNENFTYRLAFDRPQALKVRARPSTKLTRKIADRNDPNKIVGEEPVSEWVHEITHISGNKQVWSITSKKLATKIFKVLIGGNSVIDFTKSKTGNATTDVAYTVIGVR